MAKLEINFDNYRPEGAPDVVFDYVLVLPDYAEVFLSRKLTDQTADDWNRYREQNHHPKRWIRRSLHREWCRRHVTFDNKELP